MGELRIFRPFQNLNDRVLCLSQGVELPKSATPLPQCCENHNNKKTISFSIRKLKLVS